MRSVVVVVVVGVIVVVPVVVVVWIDHRFARLGRRNCRGVSAPFENVNARPPVSSPGHECWHADCAT